MCATGKGRQRDKREASRTIRAQVSLSDPSVILITMLLLLVRSQRPRCLLLDDSEDSPKQQDDPDRVTKKILHRPQLHQVRLPRI